MGGSLAVNASKEYVRTCTSSPEKESEHTKWFKALTTNLTEMRLGMRSKVWFFSLVFFSIEAAAPFSDHVLEMRDIDVRIIDVERPVRKRVKCST
jgi:hypothetical protein